MTQYYCRECGVPATFGIEVEDGPTVHSCDVHFAPIARELDRKYGEDGVIAIGWVRGG